MPTYAKPPSAGERLRWSQRQQRLGERQTARFDKAMGDRAGFQAAAGEFAQGVAKRIADLADFLYYKLAAQEDSRHVLALSDEIEARFARGAQGVLIRRITQRVPDSAGNFLPTYLGMSVVGEGDSETLAMLSYEQLRRKEQDSLAGPNPTVCTPLNPTGRPRKAQATLQAAPEGYNMGYAAALGAKVMSAMEQNPGNVGKITFGDQASPLQPRVFLEDSFVFISAERWQALRRGG